MPAVPQKIRTGLVELRTHIGSVYVSPSFWERVYLLWMFRNFQTLPKQVLNRHQQQLIDKLCRVAIVSRNGPIARTSIIGAVENVYLMPDRKTEAAASTSKLVEMGTTSTEVAALRAVGSEGISIRSNRATYNRIDVGRLLRQSVNVQYISAPKQDSAEQSETSETKEASPASADSDARRTRGRNRVGWGLVAACGVVLLGILFDFREGRLAPPIAVPLAAIEAHEPASVKIPSAAAAQSERVQQSMPAERRQPAAISALKPLFPVASFRQHENTHRKAVILPQQNTATLNSTPRERLQVAGAPESGFSYPVAPNPTLTGNVSLKAVIGTDGTVTEVDVLSGKHALAGAAARAVRHWRYRPRELKGHAVEAETNIVISFVGADAVSISFPAAH
jgi:Gram-negative bacterial TonB protein C-terminal